MYRSLGVIAAVFVLGLGIPVNAFADSVSLESGKVGEPIEPSTSYSILFEDVLAPSGAGTLTVTETNGDFNSATETIAVVLESIDLGAFYFKKYASTIQSTLSLQFDLTAVQMKTLAADGDIGITLTTSSAVDQSVGSSGWSSSWGSGTSWMTVALDYQGSTAVDPNPEPATWVLILAGCGAIAWRRRRKGN
jgi:hypothetical protein